MELCMDTLKVLRNIFIGCVVIGLCNSVHLYTIYANQLKDIFYFTQTNMQIIGALAEMSFNTAFPAGWLLAKCGSRVTMTSAVLMTSLGYSLLWVAVSWCEKFQINFVLFCFIFVFVGFGSGSGLTTIYHTLSAATSVANRGKVLCFVSLAGGFIQTILTLIHGNLFSETGQIQHPVNMTDNSSAGGFQHPVNLTNNNSVSYSVNVTDTDPFMTSHHGIQGNNVTMDTPLLGYGSSNLCSSLPGFFLLMVVVTLVFEISAAIFLVYKPSKKSDLDPNNKNIPDLTEHVNENKRMSDAGEIKEEQNHGSNMHTGQEHEKQNHGSNVHNVQEQEKQNHGSNSHIVQEHNVKEITEAGDGDSKTLEALLTNQIVDNADSVTFSYDENEKTEICRSIIELSVAQIKEQTKDIYGFTLLKVLDFHLIIWPGVLLGGVQVAYMYNLTAMMKSSGLEEFSTILLTINFLSCALTRIPVFVFIDRVPNKSLFLLLGAISMSIAIILSTAFGHNVVLFTIGIILSAFTNSCIWTATQALLSELFGTKYFGYNFGWMLCGYGLLALVIQSLTGYLYDMNIDISVTHACYGRKCFVVILLLCLGLCVVSLLCAALHLWKGKLAKSKK